MTLEPMVEMIGTYTLRHGERGRELDPENQYACLCGEPDYMLCPNFGDGILGVELSLDDSGRIEIKGAHDSS